MPTRMALAKAAINSIDVAINQHLKALKPKTRIETRAHGRPVESSVWRLHQEQEAGKALLIPRRSKAIAELVRRCPSHQPAPSRPCGCCGLGPASAAWPRWVRIPFHRHRADLRKLLYLSGGIAPWTVFLFLASSRSNPAPGRLRPATIRLSCAASPRCCSRPGSSKPTSPATTAPRPWACRSILEPAGPWA